MRMILFFDLPMVKKADVKRYTQFRKFLIKKGFLMLQFSVYSKIFNNFESCKDFQRVLNKNIPRKGQIRIMIVTEKQYAKMEIIIGGKSKQEEILTIDPFVNL